MNCKPIKTLIGTLILELTQYSNAPGDTSSQIVKHEKKIHKTFKKISEKIYLTIFYKPFTDEEKNSFFKFKQITKHRASPSSWIGKTSRSVEQRFGMNSFGMFPQWLDNHNQFTTTNRRESFFYRFAVSLCSLTDKPYPLS